MKLETFSLEHRILMVVLTKVQLNGSTLDVSQSIEMSRYSFDYRYILVLKYMRYKEGEFSVLG